MSWIYTVSGLTVAAGLWLLFSEAFSAPFDAFRGGGKARVRRKHFRGVTIKRGADCCQAVKRMDGVRYLVEDVPILPLAECNRETCTCTYQHHADRRSETRDRRLQASDVAINYRVQEGRRKSDWRAMG